MSEPTSPPKKDRCPNGTRRNQKTKKCEPYSPKAKTSIQHTDVIDWKTSLERGKKYMVYLTNRDVIHGKFDEYHLNVDGTHKGLIISGITKKGVAIHHDKKIVHITGNTTFPMDKVANVKSVGMNETRGGKSRKSRKSRR